MDDDGSLSLKATSAGMREDSLVNSHESVENVRIDFSARSQIYATPTGLLDTSQRQSDCQ